MRISFERGVPSAAVQLVGGSLLIAAPIYSVAWWVGWFLLAFGVGLLIWGIRLDGKRWWHRRKRPVLYVSHVRERLPLEGPHAPFCLYSIPESNPKDALYWGWSEHSGAIPWGWPERPWAQRIEVTNHGDETLVNVVVDVRLTAVIRIGEPPMKDAQIDIRFDQVKAGETGIAFIVNDSSVMAMGQAVSASGTPIGGKPRDLKFHTRPIPSGMMLPPADRFLTDYIEPKRAEITPRHKEILQGLATPLARVYELSMAYGTRDLAGIANAKGEAQGLIAEIPYDEGTSEAVKDFLNYCDRLIGDWQDHVDERPNRELVHRASIGLFRFLHEGKPVDRSQINRG